MNPCKPRNANARAPSDLTAPSSPPVLLSGYGPGSHPLVSGGGPPRGMAAANPLVRGSSGVMNAGQPPPHMHNALSLPMRQNIVTAPALPPQPQPIATSNQLVMQVRGWERQCPSVLSPTLKCKREGQCRGEGRFEGRTVSECSSTSLMQVYAQLCINRNKLDVLERIIQSEKRVTLV